MSCVFACETLQMAANAIEDFKDKNKDTQVEYKIWFSNKIEVSIKQVEQPED